MLVSVVVALILRARVTDSLIIRFMRDPNRFIFRYELIFDRRFELGLLDSLLGFEKLRKKGPGFACFVF